MDKFWTNAMNYLLGDILYHGMLSYEETWVEQYKYEVENIVNDIKSFHTSIKATGLGVSNETMAMFLIYSESKHIRNSHVVQSKPIDMMALIALASRINDELN